MKKYLFILILQIPITVFAQITFVKTYFANSGYGATVFADTDGYILAGTINYSTQYQPILIKTNLAGDTIWTRTFIYGIYGSATTDAVKTNDNSYVFINTYFNTATKQDLYLTKTNNVGNPLWTKSIKRQNTDEGYRLKQTSDNGFIIVGETNSLPGITGPYPYDAYIVKTNSLGDSTWTRNFGRTNDNDYAYDVIETSDLHYVIVGYAQGCGINNNQIYLIKLKSNGDTIWTRNIGNTLFEYGYCIKETVDKNYIITGQKGTANSYSDVYLIKTDTSGTVLWEKTYSFNTYDYGYRILVLNNGYLIAGNSGSNVLLIRINSIGDTLWTKTIQQSNNYISQLKSIDKCIDNGYLITGWSGGKLLLMKTDSLGCIKPSVISITGEQNVSLNDTITYHNNSIRGSWYYWFSDSGNIVSSQSFDNVNIYWNHIGIDTLYSVSYNDCGSDTLSYIINIDSCVVPKISSIYGNFNPALGSIEVYHVNKIEGKTPVNYNWAINLGTIISGQGTDAITIKWDTLGIDNMVVNAINICGSDTLSASVNIVFVGIRDTIDIYNVDVFVFPIPTNNILYLNSPFDFNNYKVEIFDIYGKRKYYNSMLPGLNEINLSDQSNGMYFLKITSKNKIIIKKIILTK